MALLEELGTAVRRRRQEIGLSQAALAELAGLSRATVVSLENGNLGNLSSSRIETLANSLGFAVGLQPRKRQRRGEAIEAAARMASVPYRNEMPAAVLKDALSHGLVPPGFIPQMRSFLQEAPVATLAAVAEELEREHVATRRETWARMRAVAAVLKCDRPLWAAKST